MDTIKFWQSWVSEFQTCGEKIGSAGLLKAFPFNYSAGFLVFNLSENENRYLTLTERGVAEYILFIFQDRIRKAHQAQDQTGFEYLIRQRIPIDEMESTDKDVPFILLLAHSGFFSGNCFLSTACLTASQMIKRCNLHFNTNSLFPT